MIKYPPPPPPQKKQKKTEHQHQRKEFQNPIFLSVPFVSTLPIYRLLGQIFFIS